MSLENTAPAYIAQTFRDFLLSSVSSEAGYFVKRPIHHGSKIEFSIGQTKYTGEIKGPLAGNYLLNLVSQDPEMGKRITRHSFQVKRGRNRKKAHVGSYLKLLTKIIDETKL
tara:strand:- start:75 stop:410 length:336 start_codon:yes stop_codon:yes gene_type:complete